MKIIVDTSVLIAFYTELELGHLLVSLKAFGYEIVIPEYIVRNEMRMDLDTLFEAIETGAIQKLPQIREDDLEELKFRFPSLGRGELEVIWWGLSLSRFSEEYLCVLDDLKARKAAEQLGIKIIGTLRILEILNELEIISEEEKAEIYETLRNKGFRMPRVV
jgi:predicted nucleic acid-binding protein